MGALAVGEKGPRYPRAWGTLGDQAPAPSFALRLGAEPRGKVHKLIPTALYRGGNGETETQNHTQG